MTVQILEAPQGVASNKAASENGTSDTLTQPKVSGERATYKANNYLSRYVSTCFGATEPVLLPLNRLVWQVLVYFKIPYQPSFKVGFLDVDAETGDVIPLSDEHIESLLDRADAFVELHAPSAAIRD